MAKGGLRALGQQVASLDETLLPNEGVVVRQSVPHHDPRWRINTGDEQSAFLVNGEIERTSGVSCAGFPQPGECSLEQCMRDSIVVFGLEHAERTSGAPLHVLLKAIELRRDAARWGAVATSKPGL
jgi:hypothetical protein